MAIPRNAFVVITGLSGSGKSSLAFDTLFAEGQRMYVESLSSYARQFLGRMEKPEVEYIKGVAPAIAIQQKVSTKNPRSTVGTTTVNAVAGVATFTGVGISGTAGTSYTLTFTSGSLTATQSIIPTFGIATQATITTQAAGAPSGSAFTTQPVITINHGTKEIRK